MQGIVGTNSRQGRELGLIPEKICRQKRLKGICRAQALTEDCPGIPHCFLLSFTDLGSHNVVMEILGLVPCQSQTQYLEEKFRENKEVEIKPKNISANFHFVPTLFPFTVVPGTEDVAPEKPHSLRF